MLMEDELFLFFEIVTYFWVSSFYRNFTFCSPRAGALEALHTLNVNNLSAIWSAAHNDLQDHQDLC